MDILAQEGAQLSTLTTKKRTLLLKSWHQRSAHLRLMEFAQICVGIPAHLPLPCFVFVFVFVFQFCFCICIFIGICIWKNMPNSLVVSGPTHLTLCTSTKFTYGQSSLFNPPANFFIYSAAFQPKAKWCHHKESLVKLVDNNIAHTGRLAIAFGGP